MACANSLEMFSCYEKGPFFDEMFRDPNGGPHQHYELLLHRFTEYDAGDIEEKQRRVDNGFLEEGITFTVYGDNQGTERIFPFDLIPRIIPANEWQRIEQGLVVFSTVNLGGRAEP